MKFLSWLRNRIISPNRPTRGRARRVRGPHLYLEQLEDRRTPTTVFMPNAMYVNYLENRLLGRNSGANELNAFVPILDAVPPGTDPTQTRTTVINLITGSQEYRQDTVDHIFQHYLHRSAFNDPNALNGFVSLLNNGATQEQAAALVAGSPEYFNLQGATQQGFINGLFQDALQRPATSNEIAGFAGISRSAAATAVLTSLEYQTRLVDFEGSLSTGGIVNFLPYGYFQMFLGRNAGFGESTGFVNELSNGVHDELVIAQLASSREAFNRAQATPVATPNIIGFAGFGTERFVAPGQPLSYRVVFQNKPESLGPADQVVVTHELGANADLDTFELGDFGFGNLTVTVPNGLQSYSTRIDLRSTRGVFVDVTAQLDRASSRAAWTFQALDPATMALPRDPFVGFLPPDRTAPEGEGFVSFSVRAKPDLPTGTPLSARATVLFDTNAPIDSNLWTNTIDAAAPASTVTPLSSFSSDSFNVSWAGADDAGGSGIGLYDVFASDNGGPFTAWQSQTTATSAAFTGLNGHDYAFYSVATDNVGNRQATPGTAQANTRVDAATPTSSVTPLPAIETKLSFTVSWTGFDDAGGSGVASFDVFVSDDGGAFIAWLQTTTATSATFDGQQGHAYLFYCVATDNIGNRQATLASAQAGTTVAVPSGFVYDPATKALTITASVPQNSFSFSQAATQDAAGVVRTTYTFDLNGGVASYTDMELSTVVVNGAAGGSNTASLTTNDTYAGTDGQNHETAEAVTVGAGAKVQKLDANGDASDFMSLNDFQTIFAVAGSADQGFINSTPGVKNVFVGAGGYAYMNTGNNAEDFYYLAGAKFVYSYASGPGDFAYQYDGSGASVYVVSGTAYSFMLGSDNGAAFQNYAIGFKFNEGIAQHPSQDVAYFYDSAGNDTFTGFSQYSSMKSADDSFAENDIAAFFGQVYAFSFVGGSDNASVYDSSVNHVVGFTRLV